MTKDQTQDETNKYKTQDQPHFKTQDTLLHNMDFKNPVLCLVRVRVRLGYVGIDYDLD